MNDADPTTAEAWTQRGLARLAAILPGWRLLLSSWSLEGLIIAYNERIDALGTTREVAIRGALADFSRSLEFDPKRADTWLGRARLLVILRDPEAMTCYGKAAELQPADPVPLIERSGHLLNAKKVDRALEDAAAAVARASRSSDAWAAQGRAKLHRQDAKGARKDFEKALELDPGHFPSLLGHARSRAWEEPSAARGEHERVAAATPNRAADFYWRGLSADAKGDSKQAREDFARAIDAIPHWSPEREDVERRVPLPGGRTPLRRALEAPVTSALLLACIVVMLIAEQSGDTTQTGTLIRFGATERGRVWSGEYWRLASAMFLHVGWFHLVWNTWVMFGLCGGVERLLGKARFLGGYLLAGVAASALSLVGQNVVSAGASGAAFGMIGILLSGAYVKLGGLAPFMRHRGVFGTLKWVVIWFALGLMLPFDNLAHLGGLLSGLAVGALWIGGSRFSKSAKAAGWGLVSVLLALVVAAAIHPWTFLYPQQKGWAAFESGTALLRKGDLAGAEDQFGRVIRLDPRRSDAYTLRGLCRVAQGRTEQALQDFDNAIRLNPKDYAARSARARVRATLNDPEGAARDYRDALRDAPAGWSERAEIEKWLRESGR
jgi:rhomboid protease GluP